MEHPFPYALNCSTLLLDLPLRERPAAASRLGFRWIEMWWPFDQAVPAARQVDEFVHLVQDAGVQLSCLSLANTDRSDRGDHDVAVDGPLPVLVENAAIAAELGARLGCRMYNRRWAMRREGVDAPEQDDRSVQAFGDVASAVAVHGGTLLVEAVSNVERYPVKRARDAFALLDRVRREKDVGNIAMMADLYQLAVGADDVDEEIAANGERFGYVQIADSPGRSYPGSGDLPLLHWLNELAACGYDGFVGLEYWSNDADPFGWLPPEYRGDRRTQHV